MNQACQRAADLRSQLAERLESRVPGAFSMRVTEEPERLRSGIDDVDEALDGLPVGAVSELVGPECSGRTTLALAYVRAQLAQGKVAAWLDVDDRLDPESAALSGVDLERLLWVRANAGRGVAEQPGLPMTTRTVSTTAQPAGTPLPPGGCGSPHPRSEDRGMPQAIDALLKSQPRSSALPEKRRDKSIGTPSKANRPLNWRSTEREEQVPTDRQPDRRQVAQSGQELKVSAPQFAMPQPAEPARLSQPVRRGWGVLDQALQAADLLLQAGGFGLIVLDLGSTPADRALRIPLATWFRYRAACERTQTSLLLLTRQPCARSAAALVVRMQRERVDRESVVMTGVGYRAMAERQRFQPAGAKLISMRPAWERKAPQPVRVPGAWKGRTAWAL